MTTKCGRTDLAHASSLPLKVLDGLTDVTTVTRLTRLQVFEDVSFLNVAMHEEELQRLQRMQEHATTQVCGLHVQGTFLMTGGSEFPTIQTCSR